MLIEQKFLQEHIQELMEIWLEENENAHSFVKKQYWRQQCDFVKKALPNAMLFCEGNMPIQGFLGVIDGYIAGLFVREAFQRRGVGKKLVNQAKEAFPVLTLDVFAKNTKAIAFYEAMGFCKKEEKIQPDTNEKEYTMLWQNKNI